MSPEIQALNSRSSIEALLSIEFLEEKEIPIVSVREDSRFYPREEYDESAVNRYRLDLDSLPPIMIAEDGTLLDGKHRLIAHRIEQRQTIKARVYRVPEKYYRAYAAYLNARHGLQLSMKEKRMEAERLLRECHFSDEVIGQILGVSWRTVAYWLSGVKQELDQAAKEKAFELWLRCFTQEQIAEELSRLGYGEYSQQTISRVIGKHTQNCKLAEMSKPSELKLYTVWNFPKLSEDQLRYPGQLPEALIENVLYYWTKPFQVVWDPFAGSGVTGRVARRMMRRYQLSDLAPIDDSIRQHDLLNGLPDWLVKPDLIFLDPPYWKQKTEQYVDHPSNLAAMDLDQFYQAIRRIFESFCKLKGTKVAIIVQDTQWRNDRQTEPHAFRIWQIADSLGWRFIERVICPYSNVQYTPQMQEAAKEARIPLVTHRDLIVFEVV